MSELPKKSEHPAAPNGPTRSVSILLADDHAIVRQGLRALLENEPGFLVIGEAGDGRAAIQQATSLLPDVVVVDVSMPEVDGVETTAQIKMQAPGTKVIGLSMYTHKSLIQRMIHAGAQAFLLKDCAAKDLVAAIHSVMANQLFFSPSIAHKIYEKNNPVTPAELNPQESKLLKLVTDGKNTKQIAECLELSPKTVDLYRRRLMDKLHIWSIAELTKYAIREGLTSIET